MLTNENGGIEDHDSKDPKVKPHIPLDINTSNSEDPQLHDRHISPNNKTSRFVQLRRKLDWDSLKKTGKEWIKNPMNMVLLIWILCVTISGAILFLVMTGMLNNVLPKKYQRETWFEVNNQILNALFTLICLYHHPRRIHHLVLLLRWRSKDVYTLRKVYCKDGTYKPNERTHMLIVVLLLNLNCLAQYALCGLNVGYTRPKRPAIGVAITISIAIVAPAVAGVYTIVSPLGKDYDMVSDEESQIHNHDVKRVKSLEKRLSFSLSSNETSPQWRGGVLDFWDDISIAYLSLFCSCCVFGWNMERLGLGNMYVHTATFLLLCLAPFWIFTMAAINISNETLREALGTTGLFLCVFGLLYGGFWRIQMRKRYNLPPSNSGCGKPAVTDCALWLCCCWCSLAQEVRTGNFYDIVEDKFYKKHGKEPSFGSGPGPSAQDSSTCTPSSNGLLGNNRSSTGQISMMEEGSSSRDEDATLKPPFQYFINREGN